MIALLTLDVLEVLAVLGVLGFALVTLIGVTLLISVFAPRAWVRFGCRLLRIPWIDGDQHPVRIGRDVQQARWVDQTARFGIVELPEQKRREVRA